MDTKDKHFKTAEEMWLQYLQDVVPPNAPKIQRDECRFAFYAGLYQMMCVNVACGEAAVTEDEGVQWMDDLYAEINTTVSLLIAQRIKETGGLS